MFKFKRVLLMASLPALAVVLALGVLVLRPSHASAAAMVPFNASVSENYTAGPCGKMLVCIHATGTGQATHLGAITEEATVVIDVNPADRQNGCAPETRNTTLTAANGDTITMYGTGFTQCSPTSNEASDKYTITGGTGRFQGASGSGSESNTHTFTGPGVGVASVTYSGDISSVGSLN
ncbi:MAG TPA: hypothetical protein VF116_20350 [Ktedonobacterales bacterium]